MPRPIRLILLSLIGFIPACRSYPWAASTAPPLPATTPPEIVAMVRKAGGRLTLDPKSPQHPLIGIDLHGCPVTDADIKVLLGVTTLRSLNLFGTQVTDAGLETVGTLTGLQTLHLSETGVSDEGVHHLRSLTSLRELGLYHTRVTDQGVTLLSSLKGLQKLTLGGPRITDGSVKPLAGLKSLHQLFLAHSGISGAGFDELKLALPRTQIIH